MEIPEVVMVESSGFRSSRSITPSASESFRQGFTEDKEPELVVKLYADEELTQT